MRQLALEERVAALETGLAALVGLRASVAELEEKLTGMKQQLAMHTGQLNTLRAKMPNGERNAAAR